MQQPRAGPLRTNHSQSIPVLLPEFHPVVLKRPSVHLSETDRTDEAGRETEATNQSFLEIREGFTMRGWGWIHARLLSINISLGLKSNLHGRGGSVIGVLQQFTKYYMPVFRLSVSTENMWYAPVYSPEYLARTLSMSARWFTSTDFSCPEFHCTQICQSGTDWRMAYTCECILRYRRHRRTWVGCGG